jgi:CubicO group peptidase (beta-lactamase class C family)
MQTLPRRAVLGGLAAALAPRRGPAAVTPGTLADRARGMERLRTLAVAKGGEVVFAEAFRGPPPDRPVNVKSVSKTIVAALTGAAVDRGAVPGVRATLGEVAPRLIPRGADPRVRAIAVEDMLTLRMGVERTSGAGYGPWVESRDWVAHALTRPFVDEPGGAFLYSTGTTHVLGATLAEATGRSLLDLARDWIGRPLGVEIPAWTRDPQGRYLGGNEMALSPLALLRFGEAYRTGGGGIVSPGWVQASWTPRTRSPFSGHDYGYGWFLFAPAGEPAAYARGYGGQMLYVLPRAGLTVAITSDPTIPARSEGYTGDLHALLAEAVLPAFA